MDGWVGKGDYYYYDYDYDYCCPYITEVWCEEGCEGKKEGKGNVHERMVFFACWLYLLT